MNKISGILRVVLVCCISVFVAVDANAAGYSCTKCYSSCSTAGYSPSGSSGSVTACPASCCQYCALACSSSCNTTANSTSTNSCGVTNSPGGSQTCNGNYTAGDNCLAGGNANCSGCSSWGTCYISTCNAGFHPNVASGATSCVSNTQTCSIGNGSGTQTWNTTNGTWGTGTWNTCTVSSCNAGFQPNATNTGCDPCPTGTYKTAAGASACSSCGPGYSTGGSTTSCTACGDGFFSTGAANAACTNCNTVPASTTSPHNTIAGGAYTTVPSSGANTNTACRYTPPALTPANCNAATRNTLSYTASGWQTNFYTVTSVSGSYITSNNNATPACAQCTTGSFSAGGDVAACTICAAGTTNTGTGNTACGTSCDTGDARGSSKGAWVATPTLAWNAATNTVSNVCVLASCTSPAYALIGSGSTNSCVCNAGYYGTSVGAGACTACPRGSWKSTTANADCTVCAAGQTTPGTTAVSNTCATCATSGLITANANDSTGQQGVNSWRTQTFTELLSGSYNSNCSITDCKQGYARSSQSSCTYCTSNGGVNDNSDGNPVFNGGTANALSTCIITSCRASGFRLTALATDGNRCVVCPAGEWYGTSNATVYTPTGGNNATTACNNTSCAPGHFHLEYFNFLHFADNMPGYYASNCSPRPCHNWLMSDGMTPRPGQAACDPTTGKITACLTGYELASACSATNLDCKSTPGFMSEPVCNPKTYTVSFDGNAQTGGTVPAGVSCVFDAACALPVQGAPNNLAKNGFNRDDNMWCTADGGAQKTGDFGRCFLAGASTTAGDNISLTGSPITLYVKWTPNTYPVVLQAMNGTADGLLSDEFTYGTDWTRSIALRFNVGWSLQDDGNWRQQPVVAKPARIGFTFAGYFTTATGGTQIIDNTGTINTGHTTLFSAPGSLKAQWTNNIYTMVLDKNTTDPGSTQSTPATAYLKYDIGWFSNSGATTAMSALTTLPTREGYIFRGFWGRGRQIIDEDGDFVAGNLRFAAADLTLTAEWDMAQFFITYITNGGSIPSIMPTEYWTPELPLGIPTDQLLITRANSLFAGWYETSDFSSASVSTIPIGTTGNKTFYAKWTCDPGYEGGGAAICSPTSYTLTFNFNGGTGWTPPPTYNIETPNITFGFPTRANSNFNGWFDNAGFAGTQIASLLTGSTGNRTYYARWLCNPGYQNGNVEGGGAAECQACPAGKKCNSDGTIEDCPADHYCPEGSTTPTACPLGGLSAPGSAAATDCYQICPLTTPEIEADANKAGVTNDQPLNRVYYTGTVYATCTYTITCNTDYSARNNGSTRPFCLFSGKCPVGFFCPLCPVMVVDPSLCELDPVACPGGGLSLLGALGVPTTIESCFQMCEPPLKTQGTLTVSPAVAYDNHYVDPSGYPMCKFSMTCKENYISADNNTPLPRCKIAFCAAGYHVSTDETFCEPDEKSCLLGSVVGVQTWNSTTQTFGPCIAGDCPSDQEKIGGICQACARENAVTYKKGGNCMVETCERGFHPNGKQCDPDKIECQAENAEFAEKTWSNGSYGLCIPTVCHEGFYLSANACVVGRRPCAVDNGTGFEEWSKGSWGPCVAESCNPGWTMDKFLTNEHSKPCGACRNKFGVNGEIAASSYIAECEIASCMYQGEMYNLEHNECVPICDPNGREDETGTMFWNANTHKCDRACNPGYKTW